MSVWPYVPILAAIACPVLMAGMMWWMHKHMGGTAHTKTGQQTAVDPAQRLAEPRAECVALEAAIAEQTRLVELQAKRDVLPATASGPASEGRVSAASK